MKYFRFSKTRFFNFFLAVVYITLGAVLAFIVLDWNYFVTFLPSHQQHIIGSQSLQAASSTPAIAVNILTVPSLGIQAPIEYPIENSGTVFEDSLQFGVVHYPQTPLPGQTGNVYIFGHSSDFLWTKGNYKNIFARLPKIKIGAVIGITDSQNKQYSYTVTGKQIVSAHNASVLAQNNNQHILTLQTSYPVGTALERYVVVAKLDNTQNSQ